VSKEIQTLAVDTFRTLGCSGVVRIDFMIDRDTDTVYVNELNTIPGSLAFYLWEATGLNFEGLMDEMVKLALKKGREKEQLMFTYDTNLLSLQGGLKGGIKK
ncbi:MAG: D-alanine--D-alanine ligase, partial [Bacillota bacterium]|nr:D-alanine--D-alanine ligase [Bacillota bacterium]